MIESEMVFLFARFHGSKKKKKKRERKHWMLIQVDKN